MVKHVDEADVKTSQESEDCDETHDHFGRDEVVDRRHLMARLVVGAVDDRQN